MRTKFYTQGDTKPELYYYLQGGIIININEEQKTGSTMNMGENGNKIYWEYDSVKVSKDPTRDEIIQSLIGCKPVNDNYTQYVESVADEIIGEIKK